jgi:uncharacterized protein
MEIGWGNLYGLAEKASSLVGGFMNKLNLSKLNLGRLNLLVMGGVEREYHDFSIMGPIYDSFLSSAGFDVTLSEDKDLFLPENIKNFDVIICYTTHGSLTKEQSGGLLNSIIGSFWENTGKPKGFLGIHGASCSFENNETYLRMLGGHFLTHPELGPEYLFHVEKAGHPIMKGISDFSMVDELYLQEIYPPMETLITCDFEGFSRPVAWVKSYGLGRVSSLSLGHGVEQTENPIFQKIIINAVNWCAKHI